MNKKNLVVKNLIVEYLEKGSGDLILFLHGWGTGADSFEALVRQFKDKRCIALSFPGFGKSEKPDDAWGVEEYAIFVRDFMDKLRLNPEVIVGHSFGGRVVIKGVSKGLLTPKKLVLIASAGAARKTVRAQFRNILAKVAKALTLLPPLNLLRNRIQKKFSSNDYHNAGDMKEIFIKVVNENLENDASKITLPTLLIWGKNDLETPLVEAKRLKSRIDGSELKILEGTGHFVFQEKSEEVAEEIKRFI